MKILVTGGAGFIGSNLVDRYVELGHEVTVVDNLATGKRKNVNREVKFYEMDVQDPTLSEVFHRGSFDVVNHHAAQIDVRVSVTDPMKDARTNIMGFLNVMENVRRYDVGKTVLISSGGVIYGETPADPATELFLKRPFSPYGVTKYASEQYLFYYNKVHGLKGVTLRYSNVFGPRQDPFGEAGVVAIFSKNLQTGETLTIYGDGEQERDYVFVGDVVDANMLVTESELSSTIDTVDDLAFNVGTGIPSSVNQLAELMKDIANSATEPVYAPQRPGELLRNYLDCSRLKSTLGWEPKTSFREGLQKTYDWFGKQNA
jgi:UDP-glucose 4-epimerase